MRWLITGGCGFIGSSLIRRLTSDGGHVIRVLDDLSVGKEGSLTNIAEVIFYQGEDVWSIGPIPDNSLAIELVVADVRDAEAVMVAAQDADVIVHLAANTGVEPSVKDPRLDCEINIQGTFNSLEAARIQQSKRYVFASSGAPLGEVEPPIHEEMAPHPVSPYGASKLAGEGYCSAYYRTFGVETVALRFGNVYGPGSGHKQSVVAKFIKQILEGEELVIYGDGSQTRDFIFIEDLVDAIIKAAEKSNIGGEVFQIATNKETTIQELHQVLIKAAGRVGIDGIVSRNASARLGDVMRNYSDTSKARRLLDWQAKTDLNEGLAKSIEWFQKKDSVL
jgi:UDP-glucose 4-epimerase